LAPLNPRNVLPVDPPVIRTLPSSEVPDPVIRVAVGPLRACVMAGVAAKLLVPSLYSSAVLRASHWKPVKVDVPHAGPPVVLLYDCGWQNEPPAMKVFSFGSGTAAKTASRLPFILPTDVNESPRAW
jgi:hypothetical protein